MLEIVARDSNLCGEAPIWDAAAKRLLWVDLGGSLVYEFLPGADTRRVLHRDLMVSGLALNAGDELVFAGATGLHLRSGSGAVRPLLAEHAGEALFFNDILADPKGRLYAGTIYWGANGMEKPGKLYLIEGAGRARVVDEGIEIANGLGFSPDNRTLYFADSARRVIFAYDVDPRSGDLSRRRIFVQIPRDEGLPDGLTVDRDGFVWCAQWYGSQVVRYDPEGRVERRIALPVRQVSSVVFGGDDLTDLYVTTAADPWPSPLAPPGYDPKAADQGGSLYRIRLDVQGRPDYRAALGPD
ncbi:MAG TPA: SMP-30/gluconolactonase/LRE family protein [Planctomycetota bacterium]|nr:SMP-30/gluconolactonase/LRE family protein [Planctomycetota bacterium]